eukprot:754104-Hanusia_phi.AAC.3
MEGRCRRRGRKGRCWTTGEARHGCARVEFGEAEGREEEGADGLEIRTRRGGNEGEGRGSEKMALTDRRRSRAKQLEQTRWRNFCSQRMMRMANEGETANMGGRKVRGSGAEGSGARRSHSRMKEKTVGKCWQATGQRARERGMQKRGEDEEDEEEMSGLENTLTERPAHQVNGTQEKVEQVSARACSS